MRPCGRCADGWQRWWRRLLFARRAPDQLIQSQPDVESIVTAALENRSWPATSVLVVERGRCWQTSGTDSGRTGSPGSRLPVGIDRKDVHRGGLTPARRAWGSRSQLAPVAELPSRLAGIVEAYACITCSDIPPASPTSGSSPKQPDSPAIRGAPPPRARHGTLPSRLHTRGTIQLQQHGLPGGGQKSSSAVPDQPYDAYLAAEFFTPMGMTFNASLPWACRGDGGTYPARRSSRCGANRKLARPRGGMGGVRKRA